MSTAYVMGAADEMAGMDFSSMFNVAAQAQQALSKRQTQKPSLLSRLVGGISKAGNWFDRNAQNLVQVTDAVGRLRNRARVDSAAVEASWDRNIRHEPRNWFGEEMIPGVPNGLLVGGGVGLLVLFLTMKPKGSKP